MTIALLLDRHVLFCQKECFLVLLHGVWCGVMSVRAASMGLLGTVGPQTNIIKVYRMIYQGENQ